MAGSASTSCLFFLSKKPPWSSISPSCAVDAELESPIKTRHLCLLGTIRPQIRSPQRSAASCGCRSSRESAKADPALCLFFSCHPRRPRRCSPSSSELPRHDSPAHAGALVHSHLGVNVLPKNAAGGPSMYVALSWTDLDLSQASHLPRPSQYRMPSPPDGWFSPETIVSGWPAHGRERGHA